MSRSSTSSSDLPVTTPEGTLHVPLDLGASPRSLARFIVGLFLCVIVGTGLLDSVWPAPVPKPIGLEKQIDDARRARARWSNGSRMSLLEDDMQQRSRVRSWVRPPYTEFLYRGLHEANGDVIVGKD